MKFAFMKKCFIFMLLEYFRKPEVFLMISGGTAMEYWPEMS